MVGQASGTIISDKVGVIDLPGQGMAFLAASAAFVVDIVVSVAVSQVTRPRPEAELVGFVYSLTPKERRTDPDAWRHPWYQRPVPMAGIGLAIVIVLNVIFA